ncbi:MFS multidrug transporter [Seiridium cupressi]
MEATETTRLFAGESRESRDEEAATQTPKEHPLEWESPSDPGNPKNWSRSRKWTCTMIVSFYCLIAPTAASMVIPAMPSLARDLNITSEAFLQLTMSLFVFGWTGGPLILGPLGTGILSDLWTSDERGTSLAIYTIMPLVGPTAGPLLAGYVVQYYNWPYIFFLCSLLAAIVLVPGAVILPETFGPVILLRRRAERLRQKGISSSIPAANHGKHDTTKTRIRKGLARPFILLGTQPIIQVLALYFGFYFGLYQLFIAMYHAMWRDMYNMTPIQASANYLSITMGLILGCEIAGPFNDKIYRYLRQRNNGIDLPEYRIWLMLPAAILVPGGLLWFGWSAVAQAHWIIPNLGMATACVGIVMTFMCMQAYVMDAYPVYAASAQGALTVVRSLTAFTMPVMAPAMVHQWGYGWSSTVLAIIAVVVGSLAPAFLHLKGASLRAKSPYAAGNVNLEG